MFTELRLENFHSYRTLQRLTLRPLTLFVGANSSGKSSALRALTMLKQTIASSDHRIPLVLNGPFVDLGSYHDVIYGHDLTLPMTLGFTYSTDFSLEMAITFDEKAARKQIVKEVDVSAVFGYYQRPARIYVREAKIRTRPLGIDFELRLTGKRYSGVQLVADAKVQEARVVPDKFYGGLITDRRKTFKAKYSSIDEILRDSMSRPLAAWSRVGSDVEALFRRIHHVGPLREGPRRSYPVAGEAPSEVGVAGQNAVQALWSSRRGSKRDVFRAVDRWLTDLGIAKGLELPRLGATQFVVQLKDPQTGIDVSLPDVGFGVSQLLPALVAIHLVQPQSVLLIEQPEIHLHPRLQAGLADVLIWAAKNGRQVIVETHSEVLLSRLQRRIAEEKLKPEDVSILFFSASRRGTEVSELDLDSFGQMKDVPKGFFSEEYEERFAQARATASRQGKPGSG